MLAVLVECLKNRVFIGFIHIFYLVTYCVSYLVRLLVTSVLDYEIKAQKTAYLRGLSGFVALLIRLLFALLICNKKSPVIRRGGIVLFLTKHYILFVC